MKRDYETEALKLAKAIDVAIDAFGKYPPKDYTQVHLEHFVNVYLDIKDSVLHPDPKYKTIASLKHKIQDIFTYFQEGSGATVEYFWKELAKENLDYVRENKLQKILDRGKIRGRIEYEYVIDMLVVAQQEGLILNEEVDRLNYMIGQFEKRKK
jgi:hypothetical protein